jgi:1,4-alpha-glucan branching enzyme
MLKFIENDSWLYPVADKIEKRYSDYQNTKKYLEKEYGSLKEFANAYQYYGLHYNNRSKKWIFREWLPNAKSVFLTGDFNSWDYSSHPLKRIENGDWEIVMSQNEIKHGDRYKLYIHDATDAWTTHLPAYTFYTEQDQTSKDFSAKVYAPKKQFNWGKFRTVISPLATLPFAASKFAGKSTAGSPAPASALSDATVAQASAVVDPSNLVPLASAFSDATVAQTSVGAQPSSVAPHTSAPSPAPPPPPESPIPSRLQTTAHLQTTASPQVATAPQTVAPSLPETPFIYEAHIGMAQEKEGIGTYKEFAHNVLPRIKALGYNTVQIMGIAEHPYYGSFGYHVSNFYAPSSRFGTPDDLKYLVKTAHKLGLKVLLDLVHAHFVENVNEGLNKLDGSDSLYNYAGANGTHPHWGSKIFDYGKNEIRRFLLSNIRYWLDEFCFDGFRFDGVTSMLYFHRGYVDYFGTYENYFGSKVDNDAIIYISLANDLIHEQQNRLSIAEEVSGMPGITVKTDDGGMGFDYRLSMGIPDFWIKIIKERSDENWIMGELWRVLNDRIPSVPQIAYCESHDQALVGDKTLAFRLMDAAMYTSMNVESTDPVIERGLALHKMIRLFTLATGANGGGYLNFMGNEFGHPEWIDFPREGNGWSCKYARRQWSLADKDYLKYGLFQRFDKAMIELAKEYNPRSMGCPRLLHLSEDDKTIAFSIADKYIFVFNYHTSKSSPDYAILAPQAGRYSIVLNSDDPQFGGYNRITGNNEFFTAPSSESTMYENIPSKSTLPKSTPPESSENGILYSSITSDNTPPNNTASASSVPYLKIYNINRAAVVYKLKN